MIGCSSCGCGPSPPVQKWPAFYNLRFVLQSPKTVAACRMVFLAACMPHSGHRTLSHMLDMPCVIRRARITSIPSLSVLSGHITTTPVLCKLSSSAGCSPVRQHAGKLVPPEKEGRTRASATCQAAQKDCPWMPAQFSAHSIECSEPLLE